MLLPDQKIGHKIAAFLLADAFNHLNAAFAQLASAAAGHRIDVRKAHDHLFDARSLDGFGAGWRFALMAARFKRDNQGALRRIYAVRGRILDAVHFSMILSGGVVPAPSHNLPIAHQYRPHRGVGAGMPPTLFCKVNGFTHKGNKIQFRHGSLLRLGR